MDGPFLLRQLFVELHASTEARRNVDSHRRCEHLDRTALQFFAFAHDCHVQMGSGSTTMRGMSRFLASSTTLQGIAE
jgi:hypothetical protein